jgi:acyl carrier protein
MNGNDIVRDVLEILRRIDPWRRDITPETLIFTELDFDSLQMLGLIETLKERFGTDFFSEAYSLEDLRTPAAVARAINRSFPEVGQSQVAGDHEVT